MYRSIFVLFILGMLWLPTMAHAEYQAATSLEQNLDNVVKIWCGYYDEEGNLEIWTEGSGVVIDEEGLVLTNAHVAFWLDEYDEEGTYYYYDFCYGGVAENSFTAPVVQFDLEYSYYNWTDEFDYAFMTSVDDEGEPWLFDSSVTYGNPDSLIHGDDITLVGYPLSGGSTITSTFGNVAGFESSTWIKTDAVAEFGSSGGGAFDSLGNFVGLPTIVSAGALNSFTLIQNINAIVENVFVEGTIVRDFDTLYT